MRRLEVRKGGRAIKTLLFIFLVQEGLCVIVLLFEDQLIFEFNAILNALGCRAAGNIVCKDILRIGHFFLWTLEMHFNPDPLDLKDIVYVFDVSFDISPVEMFRRGDFLSGHQRGQCSHHSLCRRGYDMIKGCRMLLGSTL